MRRILRKGLTIGMILVLITVMFSMTVMNVNAQCQGKGTLGADQTLDIGNVQTRGEDSTFYINDGEIEYENGKPVIRLFTTTWCPHCTWIGDTFDKVAKEYIQKGEIIAYHWDVDIGDNTLTKTVESVVPKAELEVFYTFNPQASIPTFVFGSKYWRIGNGYEWQKDLEAEEAEFRTIIENLINRKKINDPAEEDSINNVMPEYTNVNVKNANELISANKDVIILDIRPETEYESYHITNSLSLPYDKIESTFFTLNVNIKDTIIIYDVRMHASSLLNGVIRTCITWWAASMHGARLGL
jgi:thiol-disulfide isomerase/thioredoxin